MTVTGLQQPPSSPGRASSQELAQANGQLTSQGGQSGGTSQQPTDNLARSYNVGTPNFARRADCRHTRPTQGRANAAAGRRTTAGHTAQQGAQNTASVSDHADGHRQTLLQALSSAAGGGNGGGGSSGGGGAAAAADRRRRRRRRRTAAVATEAGHAGADGDLRDGHHGPFSTTTGASPAPYLTGAFAGTGNFTVSPILGYQTGGLNADGTPDTTSRQFQAGLSVTGQGAEQNATLFVMTSAISNAPNIGFTQAGGFTGVTMRNAAGWYGLASGAVSSATPTSAPNSVPTQNGVPIAASALNNTKTNLHTGTVANSQSYNYVQSGPANYTFNPITTGTPTTSANNHPTLTLNGYVGGVMVTASGGARRRRSRTTRSPMS